MTPVATLTEVVVLLLVLYLFGRGLSVKDGLGSLKLLVAMVLVGSWGVSALGKLLGHHPVVGSPSPAHQFGRAIVIGVVLFLVVVSVTNKFSKRSEKRWTK